MIWVDRVAKKICEQKNKKQWVDDMKTPSGRIHVGSLRGVIIHDLIYKVLKENDVNVEFSYVFNNMDPMDGLPVYLDRKKYLPFMGMPLYKIPSPDPKFKNFAEYFALEFIGVFNSLNCHPKIIWSSQLYGSGKMDEVVKTILNKVEKVKEIYKKIANVDKGIHWYPYNPICEKCSKIGTTSVYKWDGKYVYYRCFTHGVKWATGCGHEGRVEPIGENGKLVWKMDWPAHWKVIGVTIESSGKDHMSSGGSYDMACHICREVLGIEPPNAMGGYEWFTIGGKKMSSSKGVGSSAKEIAEVLPPEVFRFLFVRNPITTHIDFDPDKNTLLKLFDDYDRCLNSYYDKIEGKITKGKQGEIIADFARIAELSQVKPLSEKRLYLPRFRTVYNLLENNKDNFLAFFETIKKSPLLHEEKNILEERIVYAKKLINRQKKKEDFKLNDSQKSFLKKLGEGLKKMKNPSREKIQELVFNTLKENNYEPKEAFQGFYRTLRGSNFGPKAADLILQIGIEKTISLLKI